MSCSPPQATSASPRASSISPWLRLAHHIARTPPRLSARFSTRRRPSSQDLACAFAWQCIRLGVSDLLSPALQSSAAPPRRVPRHPDRRRNRTFLRYPMSGALRLVLPVEPTPARRREGLPSSLPKPIA